MASAGTSMAARRAANSEKRFRMVHGCKVKTAEERDLSEVHSFNQSKCRWGFRPDAQNHVGREEEIRDLPIPAHKNRV